MRLALLIHVHTNPRQVARLAARLNHPDVDIYINVDGKAVISNFEREITGANFITNRIEVRWGRFSQTQQILNSFDEISNQKIPYSHILFISGQDYPVCPIGQVVNFLNKNLESSYIDFRLLGNDEWSNLMKKRYEYWHFLPENDIRNNNWVKKILQKAGFKRKYPFDNVYYGSCWFCLSMNAVNYLLEYTEKHPGVVKFFKHSGCSDELYIQSVLLNSGLKDKMHNKIYRYIDWSDMGKSPKILTSADFQNIKQSDAWFARKLDSSIDNRLFDLLDTMNR